ncbi:MAG: hypothetical protein Q8R01_02250 [Ramlibacter sp.]|nr:hypothetical protein [Ramlibacter sp.]
MSDASAAAATTASAAAAATAPTAAARATIAEAAAARAAIPDDTSSDESVAPAPSEVRSHRGAARGGGGASMHGSGVGVSAAVVELLRTRADRDEEAAEIAREPWRAHLRAARREHELLSREPREARRAAYVAEAVAGRLVAEDALVLGYALFGSSADRRFFSAVLLRREGLQRLRAHNWRTLARHDEFFVAGFGARVQDLAWPLFPPHERLTPLNRTLLRETAAPSGGAGGRDVVPSVFRRADPAGGGYMAPVVSHAGGYAVDLGPAEVEVIALRRQLEQLQGDLTRRLGQIDAALSQRAPRASNNGAPQGRGSHGASRGGFVQQGPRRRGGGRGARGGEAEESEN